MIKEKIEAELKEALKQGEAERVSVLRMLIAALHNQEIDKHGDLTDEELTAVVQKEIKKRKEAVEAYRTAGRAEMADKEDREAQILAAYLPPQLSDEELENIIKRVIGENPGLPEGPLLGKVMQQVRGQADSSRVIAMVKSLI
jgi:hypothetical protein